MGYIINLGDSRALYSYDGGKYLFQATRDQKPEDPRERKRIEKYGGEVYKADFAEVNGKKIPEDGQILNTNSQWLSEELNNMGFDVMYHYTVGDNASRLEELLKFIYHDCDLILTTGGLGPTQDDLTKETIAKAFNVKLIKSDIWMEELERLSRERYGKLTENNYKQAYIPFGSELLFNEKGSAPGFWLEKDGKIISWTDIHELLIFIMK